MTNPTTRRMSDLHEAHVAALFGTQPSRGSGNQFHAQMDGRSDSHVLPFAFSWDCKSTLARSIGVTEDMWSKACFQSGWERTSIPLRYYRDTRLSQCRDLIVVDLNDFHEMWKAANGLSS